MLTISPNLKKIHSMTISLGGRGFTQLLWDRLFSLNHYYVMKLNLKALNDYPLKRKPVGELSLLNETDLLKIKQSVKKCAPEDRREILGRIHFYDRGFHNCYVMKVNDKIAYFQWMLFPNENEIIKKHFKNVFYPLKEHQVMIENAFAFPEFRGRGYLPFVSRLLLNKAKEDGYKSSIGYIRTDKIASLNEFFNMGFKISRHIRELKLLGKIYRNLKTH